ncbi:hypothetical protein FisN_24Lh242 [Fistulifera solaris]|uniref:PsbP C-terminal domain-containing protein n=1 Tax=Fistulifera solaris TaxID=1519565 RepID=A0A1Z5K9L6_FISSO|nr:hypothetical protein FisN_24Lh242 [Fistulifera solaris]|eukprot:GAX22947.1 hypothetical protein FisN_24Lh242 [Fistulifera solaris]
MKGIRVTRIVWMPIPILILFYSAKQTANALVTADGRHLFHQIHKSSRLGLVTRLSQTSEKTESGAGIDNQKQPALQLPRSATINDIMTAMGTSPRRIFLSFTSSAGIALVGNLFGVTSSVLSQIDEDLVESTGLDLYYPRGDYKRYRTVDYAFVIPKEWVADTAVELAKAQRRTQPLDYRMRQTSGGTLPDSAFGPPGRLDNRGVSQGDTNVSVIQSPFSPGFSLRDTMKTPSEGALFLLNNSIARPESGRKATLLDASERNGVYQFEYRVDPGGGRPPLRSISVLAQAKQFLYTMTVVAPEKDWTSSTVYESKLRKIAESFHLR